MRSYKFAFSVLMIFFIDTFYSQQIIQLGAWPNNPNFTVKYHQNRCIVGTGSPVRIIDFTIPSSPVAGASLSTPSGAFAFASEAVGNYAYFAGGMGGYFMIADVSNMNSPVQTGSVAIANTVKRIAISGNYAYVPAGSDSLYAINITNKNSPFVAKRILLGNNFAQGVFVKGNYAYVATTGGLKVVNITNPLTMSVTSTIPGSYNDMVGDPVSDRLFVSNGTSGFEVFDITSPASPVWLYQGSGGSTNSAIEYKNGYIFQADNGPGTVAVYKINPGSANFLCSYNTGNQINSINAKDSVFFVADNFNVHCFKLSMMPVVTAINSNMDDKGVKAYPNPSKGSFTVELNYDFQNGSIIIYDLEAREIYKSVVNKGINKIDLSNQSSGSYNYKVVSEDGILFKGKLFIN